MIKTLIAALFAILAIAPSPDKAHAYSYASPNSAPLITGRAAYLAAVNSGDWLAVSKAYAGFQTDINQLETADTGFSGDAGLSKVFTTAIQNKDAQAAQAALMRAYVDQINRRLSGAEANISNYQTASTLVITAQAFFAAIAGDLKPSDQKTVTVEMQKALDAVGKPGVFGYGAQPAAPKALTAAHSVIMAALQPYGGAPSKPVEKTGQ